MVNTVNDPLAMINRILLGLIAAVLFLGLIGGLVSCSSDTPPASPATSTASAGSPLVPKEDTPGSTACPAGPVGLPNTDPFTTPEIEAALQAAPLPPGVVIVNEQDLYNIDDKSMIDVVVRVCQPGLVGDPLKDVATTIATAIKQSPVGNTVMSLRVNNEANIGHPQAMVRAEDFQMYTWAPNAICCVTRASWKFQNES